MMRQIKIHKQSRWIGRFFETFFRELFSSKEHVEEYLKAEKGSGDLRAENQQCGWEPQRHPPWGQFS